MTYPGVAAVRVKQYSGSDGDCSGTVYVGGSVEVDLSPAGKQQRIEWWVLWLLFNKVVCNSEAAVPEAFPLCSWPRRPSRCPGDTTSTSDTDVIGQETQAMISAAVRDLRPPTPILDVSELPKGYVALYLHHVPAL